MRNEFDGNNVGKVETHQSMEDPYDPYTFDAILDRLESGKNGCLGVENPKPYVVIPGWST